MKPLSSVITISPEEQPSEIGTQVGGLGWGMPADTAAPWLARHLPSEVEAVVQSRASRHGVALRVKYDNRYPPEGGSYSIAVGCECDGSVAARASMEADLVNFLAPAEQRTIEGWLAELSVIVARRQHEAVDEEVRLVAYASRLSQYPADVVRYVLIGKTWKFWPTWAELERECLMYASPRVEMLRAVRRPIPPTPPESTPPTPEERAKVEAEIRALVKSLEAKARQEQQRVPHWSETAKPDDPRWKSLRKSRAANPLMNPQVAE